MTEYTLVSRSGIMSTPSRVSGLLMNNPPDALDTEPFLFKYIPISKAVFGVISFMTEK